MAELIELRLGARQLERSHVVECDGGGERQVEDDAEQRDARDRERESELAAAAGGEPVGGRLARDAVEAEPRAGVPDGGELDESEQVEEGVEHDVHRVLYLLREQADDEAPETERRADHTAAAEQRAGSLHESVRKAHEREAEQRERDDDGSVRDRDARHSERVPRPERPSESQVALDEHRAGGVVGEHLEQEASAAEQLAGGVREQLRVQERGPAAQQEEAVVEPAVDQVLEEHEQRVGHQRAHPQVLAALVDLHLSARKLVHYCARECTQTHTPSAAAARAARARWPRCRAAASRAARSPPSQHSTRAPPSPRSAATATRTRSGRRHWGAASLAQKKTRGRRVADSCSTRTYGVSASVSQDQLRTHAHDMVN